MNVERESQPTLKEKAPIKSLVEQRKKMAQEVRDYVKNQVKLWRQIPNWALEAEGHSGYSDNSQRAYYYKVYPVSEGKYGYEGCIELTTGRLIYHPFDLSYNEKRTTLADDAVLRIDPEDLDASKLLARFKKQARSGYWGGYNPRKIAQNRADTRAEDSFLQKTLPKELSLEVQENKLKSAIAKIEKLASEENSELTEEQTKNAINHVLRASDYDDRPDGSGTYSPVSKDIKGSHEVMQCVSFYIELKSKQFAPLFADLSNAIWHAAVSVAEKVRKERGLKHFENPELMYKVLGEEYTKRAGGNEYMFANPPTKSFKLEGIPLEIADWLINTPAY